MDIIFSCKSIVIADLCRQFADKLYDLPPNGGPYNFHEPPDKAKVLWAFAGIESNFGQRMTPNQEDGYDWGGCYANKRLLVRWGSWAACSYGAFQIMYPVALELGFKGSPLDLCVPSANIDIAIKYLNNRVIGHPIHPAKKITDLPDAYNSGNHFDRNVPEAYIKKWVKCYTVPMP